MTTATHAIRRHFAGRTRPDPLQIVLYLLGCVLFSIGVKMFIDADLGTDPLHALIIGIVGAVDTPFVRIGTVESAITIGMLVVWSVWNRAVPPLMTFVTMALVGYLIDFWNVIGLEQWTTGWLAPVPLMLAALLIDAYASALIIMSGIGIRVMDLIAIAFVRKLGWTFLWAKLLFEVGFVVGALAFGGPVGMGTVGFVVIVGTLIPPMMWASERLMGLPNHGLGRTRPRSA
ncbi:YczE/YyaS/YitT family protein [Marinivivus vitaminiproducens]|uniref:YczE/YyaS/YitT family protein n=1 Tax=Marinivivus vitaminiproducens TaxID=3035935 RepID=UPI00279A7D1B|nr:hypothetical protein P4R82_02305 [Geminicoccaceae bacterium SCSIO 64248]